MSKIFEDIFEEAYKEAYKEGVIIGKVELYYLDCGMPIQDIAKKVGISEEYVEEIIDNEINSKAKEEGKLKAKLDIAEKMLKNSTLSITEISDITELSNRQICKLESKLIAIPAIAKNLSKLDILSVSNISEITKLSANQLSLLQRENIMSSVIEEIKLETRAEENVRIAKNLLRIGTVSITDIAKGAELSEEQVLKIKEEIK